MTVERTLTAELLRPNRIPKLLKSSEWNGVDLRDSRLLVSLGEFTADALLEAQPAERLVMTSMLREYIKDFELMAVRMARADGLSWSQIGRALGVSKQAVSQRYGDVPDLESRTRERFIGRGVAVYCTDCDEHVGLSRTGDTASLSAKVIQRHEKRAHSKSPVDRVAVARAKDELRRGGRDARAGRYLFRS